MSNGVVFRSQLASIMEVLANAAVEEICKIVDDGYAILHLEMSEYQKENESLKMKLHMMELKVAQGCAGGINMRESSLTAGFDGLRDHPKGASKERPVPAANRVFGQPAGGTLSNPRSVLGEDLSVQPVTVKQDECADLEEDKTVLIKEEKPEEDNEALSELKISDGGAGGPDAGGEEWATTANSGIAPSERTEDLTAQCRGRHSAWESADVEERRADVKEERLEEMKIREEGPGKWDAVCSHTSETLPGSLLDHSLPPAVKSAGNSQPTFQYPRSTQDLVATDSSPAEVEAEAEMSTAWSKDTGSGRIQIQHRHYNEGRERESAQSDSGTNMLFVHTQMGLSETPLASSAHSVNGFAACNQSLPPPQSRVCHQHTGTEKRKLICKYCGKGFNFSSEMKLHHRVHTGEKPFACTHCGRRFSQSCSLKKHQSVHTGEKPFSCIQCGKKFSDTGNLRRHMNVHTGYKPFRCVHCGKEYCDSRDLKRHQAIHTEKERQSGSVQWRLAYSST